MNVVVGFFRSTLGRKYIMALTGILLFVFVVGHMLGNLQIFLGPEAINRYGSFLQNLGELLWVARIGLLVAVGLHVWAAISLSAENRAARPVAYGNYVPKGSTYASRTMLMSGLIIAAFVIYHLLHYTVTVPSINFTGTNFAELHDEKGRHDVYRMMIIGFRQPIVSIFYVVGMVLLSLHLSHGVSSMFQSLGLKNKNWAPLIDGFAKFIAIALVVGYCSIPLAVLLGLVGGSVK
jgi:succinate dehydrogenase / fumarate reductase, cytochrome b subunit